MKHPKILYFYDPLCGWCYAFSPELKKLMEKHPNWEVEVITGGMVRGASEGPIGNMSEYILGALPRVEEMSSVTFGEEFKNVLRAGTQHSSSIPPSRALAVVKRFFPEEQYAFSILMQRELYQNGSDLNDNKLYFKLFEELELSTDVLTEYLEDELSLKWANEDFQFAANCGISGYPALVIQKEEEYFLAAKGFTRFEQLEEVVDRIVG